LLPSVGFSISALQPGTVASPMLSREVRVLFTRSVAGITDSSKSH
jgi:hypothetical protein